MISSNLVRQYITNTNKQIFLKLFCTKPMADRGKQGEDGNTKIWISRKRK